MSFELHPRLAADTVSVGRFSLSWVLMCRDASYPWCLLVPCRAKLKELHDLSAVDQHQLMDESSRLAKAMVQLFRPDSMNVAALGNVVEQLHVHHVARFRADRAWPAPIWGATPPVAYSNTELEQRTRLLQAELEGPGFEPTR